MARLDDALAALGLTGEIELEGSWLTLHGDRWRVYVIGTAWGPGFYTWGGDPQDRLVEVHRDPSAAIRRGLQRAARPGSAAAGA